MKKKNPNNSMRILILPKFHIFGQLKIPKSNKSL